MEEVIREGLRIPGHIAIILDGNGRYAAAKGLPRKLGHKAGCENLEQIVEDCARLGVGYLTVYGFSTENWKRSEEEVGALMTLFRFYLKKIVKVAMDNNVKVKAIGRRDRFDADIVEGLRDLERTTGTNTGMTFVIAIDYGSRDEMTRAIRRMAEEASRGYLDPADIDEGTIGAYLDTADIPDPDLLIRTGGEQRISNFLLWQSAYAEFEFPETLWPDFHREQLMEAIRIYNQRDRRFGGRNESKV